MLLYIERKGILGQDGSLAVQKSAAATRTGVELANCVDFARRTRDGRISLFISKKYNPLITDVPSAALRLGNFLDVYRARQMKQRNLRTGQIKANLIMKSN